MESLIARERTQEKIRWSC